MAVRAESIQYDGVSFSGLKGFLIHTQMTDTYNVEVVHTRKFSTSGSGSGGTLCLVNTKTDTIVSVINRNDWLVSRGDKLVVKSDMDYKLSQINTQNIQVSSEPTTVEEHKHTLIGKLVDCGGQEPLRILERIEVAIAADAPRGYVTETRFIGVQKNGLLTSLQPYQMIGIVPEVPLQLKIKS